MWAGCPWLWEGWMLPPQSPSTPHTPTTLKLTVSVGKTLKPATSLILKLLWCRIDVTFNQPFHDQLGWCYTISKALACITLSSGAITLLKVTGHQKHLLISFWWCHNVRSLATYCASSVLGSVSICNNVWWCLLHFLHIEGAQHLLAMCCGFQQF